MCMGIKPSGGSHSPRTLNNGCNSNNKDTFSAMAAAAIAGEAVEGDAATRVCPINKEPTWQCQISKVLFKQAGRGTNSSSNSKEVCSSHLQWRTATKGPCQQTVPTVGPTDMR